MDYSLFLWFRIRDGQEMQFLARELVPGDLVILNVGDRVPADLRLTEVNILHVSNSLWLLITYSRVL